MADTAAPREPLGVGGLLSQVFGLFFSRILLFFGIAFIPSLILSLLSWMSMGQIIEAQASGAFVPPEEIFNTAYFVFLAGSMLAAFLITGVSTLAAYDTALSRPIRIGAYVGRTLKAIVPIIVLGIAFYVMMMIGLVLLVVPGLYLIARFYVFTPAILVEDAGFSGLSRASELSRGYRWPIVGAVIVFFIAVFLVSFVSQLTSALVLGGAGGIAIFVLAQAVASSIIYGLSAVFAALLYARLREIKEGMGMRDLATVFE